MTLSVKTKMFYLFRVCHRQILAASRGYCNANNNSSNDSIKPHKVNQITMP